MRTGLSAIRLLILLLTLPCLSLRATHLAGGEITYRYIGDSTNTPHHYQVYVDLYRTNLFSSLGSLPATADVCVYSSCYPSTTVTLQLTPGMTTSGVPIGNPECSMQQMTTLFKISYTGTIVLPGVCHDWRFYHTGVCCRVPISNIVNFSTSPAPDRNHFLAYLNNTLGNNNSPFFTADPITHYCINRNVTIVAGVDEIDGDSLTFDFGLPRNSLGCPPASSPAMTFDPSYNIHKPFDTQGNVTIAMNQSNGNMSFPSGSVTGHFISKVVANEYRLNPADSTYVIVGRVFREVLITFESCSDPQVLVGFLNLDPHAGLPNAENYFSTDNKVFFMGYTPEDSISFAASPTGFVYYLEEYTFSCPDTLLTLSLKREILTHNISPSNFFLMGPDTQLVAVQNITYPGGASPAYSDEIILELSQPIHLNGHHFLTIVQDTANLWTSICASRYPDTMIVAINAIDCPDNLTVEEHEVTMAHFYPNPATDVIHLENAIASQLIYTIYDMRGALLMNGTLDARGKRDVSIGHFSQGHYVLKLEDPVSGKNTRHRVIVNR